MYSYFDLAGREFSHNCFLMGGSAKFAPGCLEQTTFQVHRVIANAG